MDDVVIFIAGRFPAYRSKVLTYIENDEDFSELCEDFYSCVQMLENGKKGEREYLALARDLENEIATYLARPVIRQA